MGAAHLQPQAPAQRTDAPPVEEVRSRSVLGDMLRLYRVRDWLHFLPLPLAGWFFLEDARMSALVGGVLGWGFGLAYTAAINQAFDDRLDRLNQGKNPVGYAFVRRQAVLLSLPAAIACLLVTTILSPAGVVPAVLLIALATLYSAPPRLKRIAVVNTIANVAIGLQGLFFAGGVEVLRGPLRLLVGLFALLLLVSQLIHEAKDRDDDSEEGITTFATLGGVQGALAAAALALLPLPAVTWWLAADVGLRMLLTVAATVFTIGWVVALLRRILRNDATALREVRLRYRYGCLVLGALAFIATVM